MSRRLPHWLPRPSFAASLAAFVACGALATRSLVGCSGDTAGPSVFGGAPLDAGEEAAVETPPLVSDSGSVDPPPVAPPGALTAGPPVDAPVCDPSVARESCVPPETVYPVPSTITVAPYPDGGCWQSIHTETRDGGAFACIVGSTTSCYGPLALGTSYPFTVGHSSASGAVTATFNVRFDGDGGVPGSVALDGCFP